MSKSTHAQTAAMIRKHIKSLGIKAQVTSDSYAGGNSVRVSLTDETPAVCAKIEEYVNQFQYGSFNGMQDLYEYTNTRNDIPQVKYVFVNNHASPEMRQKIWDFMKGYYAGMEGCPADVKDAQNYLNPNFGGYADQEIWRLFSGGFGREDFWLNQGVSK